MELKIDTPQGTYTEPEYKEEGIRQMAQLIRKMLNEYGIYHVQFNTLDKAVLTDAKNNPGKYPTLMVRASGYSAYWTDLGERVQNDIINRTEHNFDIKQEV